MEETGTLAHHPAEAPHGFMDGLVDSHLWVLIAFVAFFLLLGRMLWQKMTALFDARSERIRAEIEEAKALKEEAQALLAQYQRRQRDALKEAERIVEHAEEEARRLREEAMEKLDESLKRREAQAVEKIHQAEQAALDEVKSEAVRVAFAATADILAEKLDKPRQEALVDATVAALPGKLN
jgi:F-type H+-transporting ATPase subunit b